MTAARQNPFLPTKGGGGGDLRYICFSADHKLCYRSYKIDEGAAGARHCAWSPDGRSVLVVADFQIRLSIYSMFGEPVHILRGPKNVNRGMDFSPNGELLAYAEASSCS